MLKIEEVDTEIRFIGLKRSGNHALLNWIIQQCEGPLAHYNNGRPDDPYEAWALTTSTHPDRTKLQWLIYSIEDTSLQILSDARNYPQRAVYPSLKVNRRVDVLVLRDPFNLLASRFQRGGEWSRMSTYVSGLSVSQMWVTYACEFLGRSSWLTNNCIRINYNLWCKSATYRSELAAQLNLRFSDAGYDEVTSFGGGSSFDGTRMDGKSEEMRTDSRWKVFQDNPAFRRLFRDRLLLDLAEEVFEFDEDLRTFVGKVLRPRTRRVETWNRWWRTTVAQMVIARLRGWPFLRRFYGSVVRHWRERKMPN